VTYGHFEIVQKLLSQDLYNESRAPVVKLIPKVESNLYNTVTSAVTNVLSVQNDTFYNDPLTIGELKMCINEAERHNHREIASEIKRYLDRLKLLKEDRLKKSI
jgi:hypothetical protein